MVDFNTPFGHSIFCDDIRYEAGGRQSYIGAYLGGMSAPSFPAIIPKFGVAVIFYEPVELARKRNQNVPIRVFVPGQEEPAATVDLPAPSEEIIETALRSTLPPDPDVPPLMMVQPSFVMTPLIIREPGRMKVRAFYPDGTVIKLGVLKIERIPAT